MGRKTTQGHGNKQASKLSQKADTHLHAAHTLPQVRANNGPALRLSNVPLGHTDHKILENAAEKLTVGQLDGVDPDVLGQLDNQKLVLRRTWAEHVPVHLQ